MSEFPFEIDKARKEILSLHRVLTEEEERRLSKLNERFRQTPWYRERAGPENLTAV